MKNVLAIATLLFGIMLLSQPKSMAQEALKPRPSPLAIATVKYEDTYVKVTYCRPHKKGRQIFGDLVPYGKVWRTGANEATELTITDPVKINGEKVDAGTYTIFTIPEKNEWTIILNKELGQWGAYNYNPDKDLMRFKVDTEETDVVYEPFTIEFQLQGSKADFVMMWDRTKVAFPIEFYE